MAKISGVYGIQNTMTGQWYVGQSQNVGKRFGAHMRHLAAGDHENEHLQRSYNKYGGECFTFQLLEKCAIAELDECEKKWIAEKDSKENGFNMTYGGGGIRGFRMSDETKAKMSRDRKGHPVSEEQRRKLSIAKSGEKHHQWGKPIPAETKAKISQTLKGEGSFWYGKHRSQELKDAVSRANKGKAPVNRRAVRCVETGEVFESIRSAAKAVGKNSSTLSEARKLGKTCAGYHWEYVDKEVAS